MCFSARYLPAVLLTILSLAASVCAQSTTKQAAKVPRGSVSGRVTIKENGVAGVAVGLRKGEFAMPGDPYLKVTTDQDGFYRFSNLAPGNYSITPSAPAYVMATKDPQLKTVLVGEDENVEGINFALVRGGVITGRVTDADGRSVIGQEVSVYSVEMVERRFQGQPMFAERSMQTDDRGIYRIFGLRPGRYKVAAGRSDDTFNSNYSERNIYRQVFHPNTDEQAKATVIEVSEGSEASNVDIALGRAMQSFSASGMAIDEKGMPVPNMRFGVQRRIDQRIEYVNSVTVSNSRGEFIIEGLIPGKYGIYVQPNQSGGDMRAEPLTFDITDQDIGGLTVRLSKGASLTGFVVLENEDKTLFAKLTELQLRAFAISTSGGGFASGGASPIGSDGSFRLVGLPGGTINFMLGAMNPFQSNGFIITRVEHEGIVTPSSRLEIKDGEQLTGVRVVITYGSATIRGMIKLENGSLPEGARILVRLAKPGETLPNFRPVTADARGHFLIEGLPAGTYEFSAMVSGSASGPPRTVKREVTLQDGQVTELNITIDMSAPVKPNQ
jgi:protocatechuate 3,4-dioxygenase beta subunit